MMEPAWQNSTGAILAWHGDCCRGEGAILPQLPENSVSCVVTDPPYDLTAGKRGGTGAASLNTQSPAGRSRIGAGGGFMGQAWDATGVAFDAATWEAVRRVAKPGAMLLAFGGTRTFHRMACAIEDAGWELRDTLMWVFGSGFPKSLDISKAIDKAAGAERDLGALAAQWRGYGTALKPAYEPIILAMNPLDGTYAANAEQWGVAGLNIDACRIGDYVNTTPPGTDRYNQANYEQGYRPGAYPSNGRAGEASAEKRYADRGATDFAATPGPRGGSPAGRWPANLILTVPEDLFMLKDDVTTDQLRELAEWMEVPI
jgi:site-specific DNA-methyltransferase (adenine-specific)